MRLKILFSVLALAPVLVQAQQSPVLLSDMLRIKQMGNVQITKDGSKVVFTVLGSNKSDNAKWDYPYSTQVWMLPLSTNGDAIQLTSGTESATQPALSPDGSMVAFTRPVNKTSQVHLLHFSGGEAMQLTYENNGASSPVWHPNGSKLLYSVITSVQQFAESFGTDSNKLSSVWPTETPGLNNAVVLSSSVAQQNPDGNTDEIRAWLRQNEKDKKAKVITRLNFQGEASTTGDISITHWYSVGLKKNDRPKAVLAGFANYSNPHWLGTSNQLLVQSPNDTLQHPDRGGRESAIYLADTENGSIKKILGAPDSSFSIEAVSPDGNWLAFTYGNTSFVGVRKLAIIRIGNSRNSAIAIPHDRSISNMKWSKDGECIYFTSPSNGGFVLYRYQIKNKAVEQLTGFDKGIGSFDVHANQMVLVQSEVSNPFELYHANENADSSTRISSFNYNWVNNKKLSTPVKNSFINDAGLTVEYWVMKPTNWQPDKKYPVILEIHGGPTAMWGPGETSMWHEYQYYCSKGYAVVYANPRGSGGYGDAFTKANMNNWGDGPMKDVLTALDKATTANKWMDTKNMAVTGGSYAGYLIAYILGHDQRFKVACVQRGVYDLRTFFGEGNAWRLVPNYFGGYPWEKATYDILERESPINYVANIKTPLIIFHGEQDLRTGVIQSEQLFKSLKVLERDVEYVRHPGATHEITRSGENRQRMDQMLRTYEFFERYIAH